MSISLNIFCGVIFCFVKQVLPVHRMKCHQKDYHISFDLTSKSK